MRKIVGPFKELLTLRNLPTKGTLKDEQLEIIKDGGLFIEDGIIQDLGTYDQLLKDHPSAEIEEITSDIVAFPGLIDCHTHICFGGSRAGDFAARNNGKSYQEIAAAGGGIWDTVTKTRDASQAEIEELTRQRLDIMLSRGITTVEIKSGYGLSVEDELKLLRAISHVASNHQADIIPTCLAAHIIPREFDSEINYLNYILEELAPLVKSEKLAERFDIFVEENAFSSTESIRYLSSLKQLGFDLTVHGDQFSTGGSQVAIEVGAQSVDHLEASGENEIKALSQSETIPVVLPGASIGLGIPFAPSRKLLDAGCSLAIASDWNPGSAPQGNLLTQAALLGTYEKLSSAEVFAGITFRAAKALNLSDRGIMGQGFIADFIGFNTNDHREILYHQGEMQPLKVWKKGQKI